MIFGDWVAGTFGGETLPILEAFSFNTASGSTTVAVTKPTGVVAGDLLLGIAGADNVARTFTPPSGFSETADLVGVEAATRTADGLEGADFTFTASSSSILLATALRISRWNTVTQGTPTNSGNSAASITMPRAGLLVAYFLAGGPSSTTLSVPSGMQQVGTTQIQGNLAMAVFQQYVGAGATGTRVSVPDAGGSRGVLVGITY